jgi:hypothetical protein
MICAVALTQKLKPDCSCFPAGYCADYVGGAASAAAIAT